MFVRVVYFGLICEPRVSPLRLELCIDDFRLKKGLAPKHSGPLRGAAMWLWRVCCALCDFRPNKGLAPKHNGRLGGADWSGDQVAKWHIIYIR